MRLFPLLPLVALLLPLAPSHAEDWPQWRGPTRDGIAPNGTSWPEKLSAETLTKVWSAELGKGYSGPIIAGDTVFTVETEDEKEEVARAFDRATGEQRWESRWKGAMKVPFFARKNGSWIRSTPAFAGGKLYVAGIRDVLVCLDGASGKEHWRVDFTEREKTQVPGFGFVCSPLIDGDALYVQAGCAVTRLNLEDGSTVWRAMEDKRAMFGSAFSSPVLATVAGRRQLLAQTRSHLGSIDPETGKELWRYEVKAFRGMNILPPTPAGDTIFTASYGGGSFGFLVSAEGEAVDAEKAWAHKVEGYMSSPILIGDHIYMHGRDKRFHCLEAATGEVKWSTDEKFGEYWSMVAKGDQILALDERGLLLHWRVSPEKSELLGKVEVSPKKPTWAHLAVVGDELYVRDLEGITRWQWR